jgi:hypothetical protein
MPWNRRTLVQGLVAASCGALSARLVNASEPSADTNQRLRCLDYGRSFICGTAPFNAVRFVVESRTTIVDPQTGRAADYYPCASCKSENTFAPKDLFQKENYDFLPVLGDGQWLIFRRRVAMSPSYRQVRKVDELWGPPNLKLVEAGQVTVLDAWEKIRDATARGVPLVAQTEIAGPNGVRAVIEYPVKTMNISLEKKLYQVDTGPIAFPDLSTPCHPQIECLRLAFVAFNASDFADFIVEQPTPIFEGDTQVAEVYHYANPFSLPAKNTLLAVGSL